MRGWCRSAREPSRRCGQGRHEKAEGAANTSTSALRKRAIFSARIPIVGVYQRHEYAAEKRDALTRWADHIDALASGRKDKVVTLRA